MSDSEELAVFPLGAVVFPDGSLPLRIFEPRYVDMISRCTREGLGFVVVAIKEGKEAGDPAIPQVVGTEVRIVDWNQDDNGLLLIECVGVNKVSIEDSWLLPDGLRMARVERLPAEPKLPVPVPDIPLWSLLAQMGLVIDALENRNAVWLGGRLVERLPLPLALKYELLCLDDPLQRLSTIHQLVEGFLEA